MTKAFAGAAGAEAAATVSSVRIKRHEAGRKTSTWHDLSSLGHGLLARRVADGPGQTLHAESTGAQAPSAPFVEQKSRRLADCWDIVADYTSQLLRRRSS